MSRVEDKLWRGLADRQNLELLGIWHRNEADKAFVAHALSQIMHTKRMGYSTFSKLIMRQVIGSEPYDRMCPCCRMDWVLTEWLDRAEGADYDHFFSNRLTRTDSGWLICNACHRKLTGRSDTFRIFCIPEFQEFQQRVIQIIPKEDYVSSLGI